MNLIPIKYLSIGEKLDQIEIFHPERIASRMLDMGDVMSLVEKAQATLNQEDLMSSTQKMLSGQFDLDDFADNLKKMSSLGGITGIVKYLPGFQGINEVMKDNKIDNSILTKNLAIISSRIFAENPSRFYLPDSSDVSYITDLIATLRREARKGIVHIAHYGDSQIEGDRITSSLRYGLQDKFGGEGLGIIPTLQMIPSITVQETISDSISRYLVDGTLVQKADHKRYGALAQLSELNGKTTITIKSLAVKHKSFDKVRLFYSTRKKGLKATLTAGDLTYEAEDEADKKAVLFHAHPSGAVLVHNRIPLRHVRVVKCKAL